MIPLRIRREELDHGAVEDAVSALRGLVPVEDVGAGKERIRKGTVLEPDDAARLLELEWTELHLLRPEEGDVPEAEAGERLEEAESHAAASGGLVAVRRFRPLRVAAVVQESLGDEATERFRRALRAKLAWFGSELDEPRFVSPDAEAVADALEGVLDAGADLVLVAGARAMDPLDPAFRALERLDARMVRHGVPAHPGSLLWLARKEEVPVVGVPSCGLFSKATVFDLVLGRALAGLPLDPEALTRLGHGGLLTPDMEWRFPPYRGSGSRGRVE